MLALQVWQAELDPQTLVKMEGENQLHKLVLRPYTPTIAQSCTHTHHTHTLINLLIGNILPLHNKYGRNVFTILVKLSSILYNCNRSSLKV